MCPNNAMSTTRMDHTESQWLPKALYDSTKILAPIEPDGRLGKIFQTLRTKENVYSAQSRGISGKGGRACKVGDFLSLMDHMAWAV